MTQITSIIKHHTVEFQHFNINAHSRPVEIKGTLTVSNYPDEQQLVELSIDSCKDVETDADVDPNNFDQRDLRSKAYFSIY